MYKLALVKERNIQITTDTFDPKNSHITITAGARKEDMERWEPVDPEEELWAPGIQKFVQV